MKVFALFALGICILTAGFGCSNRVICQDFFGHLYRAGHNSPGIDYANLYGKTIFAAASGIVDKIPIDPRGGKMVILKHGTNTWEDKRVIVEKRNGQESIRYRKPYETLYAHLSAVYVEVNQRVSRGQILGISGDTGMTFPKGPHLHFGLKELGSWVDPDFYGMNHKEIDFWNGIDNLDIEDWETKLLNQVEIYNKIMERLNEEKRNEFESKFYHVIRSDGTRLPWAYIERIKFLENQLEKNPEYFRSSVTEVPELIKEFYNNQPIKLTLPFSRAKTDN